MKHKVLDNIELIISDSDSFVMEITGYSMLPLLGHRGDKVVIRRVTEVEDIVRRIALFRSKKGGLIAHRVVATSNDTVTLQGDGNPKQKERCSRHEIIGIIEYVLRSNGEVISCTSKRWRFYEHIWLIQPRIIRSIALAIMRRWMNLTDKR